MNRRPLHRSSDKKSPPSSPKASPGRPRRTKKQDSPSIKQTIETEFSEEENDVDQDDELENQADDENNSAGVKPKNKQEKGLYPDLTRELRKRKQDDLSNIAKEGKKGSNKSTKPLYDDKPDGKAKEERSSLYILILIAVIAVIAVAFVVLLAFVSPNVFYSEDSSNSKGPKFDGYKLFKEDFNKLKSEFPDQSSRFWKVIMSQIRRILTLDYPSYPAIILLGVPHNQQALGACFTKKIVRMINKAMNASGDFYIDTQNLDGSSPDQTKLELDKRMHTALQSSKSVILDHIETLPGEAALLLHAYCDGDNAPFKNAVIFLNLHSSKTFPDSETMQDTFVEDMLVNLWQADLGQDEMPALQARIANNIAVMKTEKGNVCS